MLKMREHKRRTRLWPERSFMPIVIRRALAVTVLMNVMVAPALSIDVIPSSVPSSNASPSSSISLRNQASLAPSTLPSVSPSSDQPSLAPSIRPSQMPSASPSSNQPSLIPSAGPSTFPTSSLRPSLSPSLSDSPSLTAEPTETTWPTALESNSPSTPMPSVVPSIAPTTSTLPSSIPSVSMHPSSGPTESPEPTPLPSGSPSLTPHPTMVPTHTVPPSSYPSSVPSSLPTLSLSSISIGFFLQTFLVPSGVEFNENDQLTFQDIMASYTFNISRSSAEVTTTKCQIQSQELGIPASKIRGRRALQSNGQLDEADALSLPRNNVKYRISWESDHVNVTDYRSEFASFINENLELLTSDLQHAGLNISSSDSVLFGLATDYPSASPSSSHLPSLSPSMVPSESTLPSSHPTTSHMPSLLPSMWPTMAPPSPSSMPAGITATIVVVVLMCICALFGAIYYYRRGKHLNLQAAETLSKQQGGGDQSNYINAITGDLYSDGDQRTSPTNDESVTATNAARDQLLSDETLLCSSSMVGDSMDEMGVRHVVIDEFDQYKDQNLEKMRTRVEENLVGAEGMMSQAMTMALMADDDPVSDKTDLFWGGDGDATEIEASALCEVNDWLKRKEGASADERRAFMQEIVNKMVGSVRHGAINPDKAAHTVHECAAMLGLELESKIPETTIIVTGLRKTVTKADLEEVFRKFGDISISAVASNDRGFGLVRFLSPKLAQSAVTKARVSEIVVQDVAVTVKLLKSDGLPWWDTADSADT